MENKTTKFNPDLFKKLRIPTLAIMVLFAVLFVLDLKPLYFMHFFPLLCTISAAVFLTILMINTAESKSGNIKAFKIVTVISLAVIGFRFLWDRFDSDSTRGLVISFDFFLFNIILPIAAIVLHIILLVMLSKAENSQTPEKLYSRVNIDLIKKLIIISLVLLIIGFIVTFFVADAIWDYANDYYNSYVWNGEKHNDDNYDTYHQIEHAAFMVSRIGYICSSIGLASIVTVMIRLLVEFIEKKQPETDSAQSGEYAYCSMTKHVLLLIFTFGVWQYIWTYRVTNYLNSDPDEEYRDPTKKLLLCIFVPFYSIYWVYKSAGRIDRLAAKKQIQSSISTLCIIMAILFPLVAYIVMQDKINSIVTSKGKINNTVPNTVDQNVGYTVNNTNAESTPEQIKAYKELLESGAITQEEYDAKKRQLLGL